RRRQCENLEGTRRRLNGLYFERLLLRSHDPLQRRIARFVESFVRCEDSGKRELHDLDRALDLSLGDAFRSFDLEMRYRGDTRQAEYLGGAGPNLRVRVVGLLPPA